MQKLRLIVCLLGAILSSHAAGQDLITGGGTSLTSTNAGSVTNDGRFEGIAIRGGKDNSATVSAIGAQISVTTETIDKPREATGYNEVRAGSSSATNSGEVTSNGTFSHVTQSGGLNSTIANQAYGTSVTFSIKN